MVVARRRSTTTIGKVQASLSDEPTHCSSGKVSTVPGSDRLFSPRWSPDGRYLAALSFSSNSKQLLLYDLHSQKWIEWLSDPGGIGYPAWTSDSRYVEYSTAVADRTIRRVRLGASRPEDVFSWKGLRPFTSEFGFWGDNGPDDSRLFTRDASTQEIFALEVDWPHTDRGAAGCLMQETRDRDSLDENISPHNLAWDLPRPRKVATATLPTINPAAMLHAWAESVFLLLFS